MAKTGMTYATNEMRGLPYSGSMWKKTSWAIAVPEDRERRDGERRPPSPVPRRAAGRARAAGATGRRRACRRSRAPGRACREARSCAYVPARRVRERTRPRPRASLPLPTSRRAGRRRSARLRPRGREPRRPTGSAEHARAGGSAARRRRRRSAPSPARSLPRVESMCFSPQAMSQNGSAALKQPEYERRAPRRAQLRRRACDALRHEEEHEQQQPRHERPHGHHHARLEIVYRDLDEEVRAAPEAGQQQQPGEVAAAHGRLATIAIRDRRRSRASVSTTSRKRWNFVFASSPSISSSSAR